MHLKILWLFTAVVLFVFVEIVVQKEVVLANGQTMLLQLAPVDPRSLIQGDYMALDYAIARSIPYDEDIHTGFVVVKLDAQNIAAFVRVHNPAIPLAQGEHILRYKKGSWRNQIGANAFFFQEGHAQYYSSARYGEIKAEKDGKSVLVGLRNEKLEPLGPPQK